MTDLRKAAEMALESLNWYVQEDDVIESMAGNEPWVEGKRNAENAIQALRQALAQPEQYRCHWVEKGKGHCERNKRMGFDDDYGNPKREWVGLTDEERDWCINGTAWVGEEKEVRVKIVEAIEAKLKEKNT